MDHTEDFSSISCSNLMQRCNISSCCQSIACRARAATSSLPRPAACSRGALLEHELMNWRNPGLSISRRRGVVRDFQVLPSSVRKCSHRFLSPCLQSTTPAAPSPCPGCPCPGTYSAVDWVAYRSAGVRGGSSCFPGPGRAMIGNPIDCHFYTWTSGTRYALNRN